MFDYRSFLHLRHYFAFWDFWRVSWNLTVTFVKANVEHADCQVLWELTSPGRWTAPSGVVNRARSTSISLLGNFYHLYTRCEWDSATNYLKWWHFGYFFRVFFSGNVIISGNFSRILKCFIAPKNILRFNKKNE